METALAVIATLAFVGGVLWLIHYLDTHPQSFDPPEDGLL